jgi:tRNA (cmo5U34)-methyltransferase
MRDTLYANPLTNVSRFSFDQQVVDVFPDMIQRSVPGYATIISMIGDLTEVYAQPNSYCYDLGCSLGAATLAMRHAIKHQDCKIIGVDNSPAMIARCHELISLDTAQGVQEKKTPVELIEGNIEEMGIESASVVVFNFTLQFIDKEKRLSILQKIFNGLNLGGVLILSEKIVFDDQLHQQLMTELHHNFKRANGYSDLEIAQKRSALDNVLIPETIDTHKQRLRDAGFSSVDVWFQCFNFASFIAIK